MTDPTKPIGVFDSGIGGLTVLREAMMILPHENYLYYADTDHVPYGNKTKEQVKDFVMEAARFLSGFDIKLLLVACNTATSSAIAELRQLYSFPIVGMEPAVKPAVHNSKNKRVLVLATELTLKEQKFRELVDKVDNDKIVDMLPLPELVTFAEKFVFEEEQILAALRKRMNGLQPENYGTVVMGCTHFPFYGDMIRKIFPAGTDVIDGNKGTVKHVKNILEQKGLLNDSNSAAVLTFFHSGKKVTDQDLIARYKQLLKS